VSEDIEARKKISFEQAEGAEPLPAQLQLREVSRELRAVLWSYINQCLEDASEYHEYAGSYVGGAWKTILREEHVYRQHKMADDFDSEAKRIIPKVKAIFEQGDYLAIFGWLEFVLRHRSCPHNFAGRIEGILRYCKAAYRVIDGKVICPISSDTEHDTIVKAFADLSNTQFNGARAHLRKAASH
jgi:hypothetical protein